MDIFSYIKTEESRYKTTKVPIVDSYEWSMYEHIKRTTLYLNSRYQSGNEGDAPFKNIILPKINLAHRAVDFSVKEIDFFVDDVDEYYKSFLVRKYHEKWARKHSLATFLDELTTTYTDYGGVLVKKAKGAVPEVIPFQQIAFCDQTDILSGPIGLKHQFTPDTLKEMEKAGWQNVDEVITLATQSKTTTQAQDIKIVTPGYYIDIYEVHGVLPISYLEPENDEIKYVRQMHIVACYSDKNGEKQGITLYSGIEKDSVFKFYRRDPIPGRALGRGAVEELFEAQVWTNYSEIQKKQLLDQASKMIYQTTDPQFSTRNEMQTIDNGEVLVLQDGKQISQVNTTPINITAFENVAVQWDNLAKEISAAFDSNMGSDTKSGMPFRLGLLLNQEANSLHQYRKGQLGGQFIPEIYRDWIIPEFQKELTARDNSFLATLDLQEMTEIAEAVVKSTVNKAIVQKILTGGIIEAGEIEALSEAYKALFMNTGNKKFIDIFAEEMKGLPLDIEVNVTGEEKNKALMAEKLSSVFSQVATNPQLLDDPRLARLFNEILEASGLSPIAYAPPKQQVINQLTV